MSKKNNQQNYGKLKRMRVAFWKKDPKCYYCSQITILPTDFPDLLELQAKGITPDNMATIEHLHTRYDKERFEKGGEDNCVLACYKCNHEKERERSSQLSKEEHQKRSNRFPLSKYVSEEVRLDIVNSVFKDFKFDDESAIDKFVNDYYSKANLSEFKEKYKIEIQYISGTIKQHKNLLKRQLKNGKQQTKNETSENIFQRISFFKRWKQMLFLFFKRKS